MKKMVLGVATFLLLVGLVHPVVFAEGEEDTEYTYGTVTKIAGDQVTISEYDFEADKDVEMTYQVDPKAEFENVKSAAEVKVGDNIEIDYLVKDGKKVDVYSFRQGYSTGVKTSRAVFHGVADVFSLGLWEVVGTPTEMIASGHDIKVEITYDKDDRVEQANYLKK